MSSLLLPYQVRWVDDRSAVKVCVKSRRIGITWATGYEAVEGAALDKREGGQDFWYMTYAEDDAKEFVQDAESWTRAAGLACEHDEVTLEGSDAAELFLLRDGQTSIKVKSIEYRSGNRVTVLPALPRKLRGKGGVLCVDEADSFPDLQAALEAGHAFRMWGGRLMFISTMGDVDGEFCRLIEDIRGGRNGREGWSLHQITLLDAVAEGLYRRICERTHQDWSPEEEQQWIADLLATDGAETEFLCVPRRSGGQYLPRALVEPCTADTPVLRFEAPADFMQLHEHERDVQIDRWLEVVGLALSRLPKDKPHFIGEDFGRSSDMTSIAIGYLSQRMDLVVPLILELGNVPYESQKRVLFHVAKRLPRLTKMVFDATGNGAYLAEQALLHWGETTVEPVSMNVPWYAENLPKLRARFQDRTIQIPRDLDIVLDLGKFEVVDGVPRLPKQRANAKGHKGKRHGDAGVALACLVAAASAPTTPYRYQPVPRSRGHFALDGIL